MYYKIDRNSATGLKLKELCEKGRVCHNASLDFATKYGFKKWRPKGLTVWGSVAECADFEGSVSNIWRLNSEKDAYVPNAKSKEGKELKKEMALLPSVDWFAFNDAIGLYADDGGLMIAMCAFFSKNPSFYGLKTGDDWEYVISADCEEITSKEFNELFKPKA